MEETILSTKEQLKEFTNSFIWKDMVNELNKLAELAKLEYDIVGEPRVDDEGYKVIPNTSETLIHLGEIKGRRKAVNYFLELPNILMNILEDQVEVSNE